MDARREIKEELEKDGERKSEQEVYIRRKAECV